VHSIAGKPGKAGRIGTVAWNFDGSESGQHHRFVGNASHLAHTSAEREERPIAALEDMISGPVAFMKIDCEGCEYDLLRSSAVGTVAEIRGEFHAGFERVQEMLGATHNVTLTSGTDAFGGFKAVLR
jgi:hypothetical protein